MLTGKALIDDIDSRPVGFDQLAVWWMGQHSFIIKTAAGSVIYIDPFLSPWPSRNVPPMLRPEEVTNASIIAGTHDHADHIDRPVWPGLAKASPQATFVVPELLREGLSRELEIPLERMVGLDDGRTIELGNVRISAIASAHEFLDRDPDTGLHPYLGYILEANGVTLYHAGDTCIYEGLHAKLRRWKIDVALLPINGRDAKRLASGCIGNMTYQEAVDLAGTLQFGLTIPTHYDMFTSNPGDPQAFVEYAKVKYPGMRTRVFEYGEVVVVERGGKARMTT